MLLNDKIRAHLVNNSNILEFVGVYDSVALKDLWFFCGKCKRLMPPERVFLCQVKDEDEMRIQNVGTFVEDDPKTGLRGIDEGFKANKDIACVCGKCIESEGFSVDAVAIHHPGSTQEVY